MSDSTAGATGNTNLLFQAPPLAPGQPVDDAVEAPGRKGNNVAARSAPAPSQSAQKPGSGLRMLKGAREAAAGMHITDEQIRAVLEDPQDVQQDPSRPDRTRLRRDGLTVTTGGDGMILRVARKR